MTSRLGKMDQAIADPTRGQSDSGAATNLGSKAAEDQVSFAGGMSIDERRSCRDADLLKGNADSSASESEYQHALEVSKPTILPGCLS